MSNLTDLLANTGDRDDDGQDLHLPEWIKGNRELIQLYRNADLPTAAQFWQAEKDEPGKAQIRHEAREQPDEEERMEAMSQHWQERKNIERDYIEMPW